MDLSDWRINEQACAIVQVLNDWVQLMEGTKSYPTMPLVLPTLYTMIENLKPDAPLICDFPGEEKYQLLPHEMHSGVLAARTKLHADLVSRFITNLDENSKRQYAIATLLHPCFKEYLFLGASDAEKTWALSELLTEWRTYWKNLTKAQIDAEEEKQENADIENELLAQGGTTATTAQQSPAQTGGDPPVFKKQRTVSVSSLMRGTQVTGFRATATASKDQLQEYLTEPPLENLDVKVLEYWKAKEYIWPELARMVKQYLAAPASSAGVERVFSAAGRMHDDMRKAMKEGTLKHSLFAAQNAE